MTSGGKRSAGLAALLLLFAACAAPPRRGEAPSPPPAPPPAPSRPAVPVPPTPSAVERPIRVRIAVGRETLLLDGEGIRARRTDGTLLASSEGLVSIRADVDAILWNAGERVGSPLDVRSSGGIRVDGKRIRGAVRLIASDGRLTAIALIPLEEYVSAVLAKEVSPSFLPEALAAQAVAVRTYALLGMSRPRGPDFDLVSDVEDQVFDGFDNVSDRFREAAESTRGEALYYRGTLARAVYHSTCGGRTESAENAWGTDVPYLRSVVCDDCRESPVWRWEYRMDAAEGRRVAMAVGVRPGKWLTFEVTRTTSSGRAARIRVSSGGFSLEISASRFRRMAGYAKVRSLAFTIVPYANGWVFHGKGYGHGVGMCQWGANGMAKEGASHREILQRYYPGTELRGGNR
jgi:stage II sporulation protein D (peptidoglycan lytic transglycosylase)